VGVGVLAGELARVVGPARLEVVTVGDHEVVDAAHRPFAGRFVPGRDRPRRAVVVLLELAAFDHRLEPHEPIDAEVARVALEVLAQVVVARVVGVVLGHRVVVVLGEVLGRDDVRGLEDRRVARVGVEDPVAADLLAAVPDHEVGEPGVEQVLRGGDTRRAGADDPDACVTIHVRVPPRVRVPTVAHGHLAGSDASTADGGAARAQAGAGGALPPPGSLTAHGRRGDDRSG
jgi:hypothetical protein